VLFANLRLLTPLLLAALLVRWLLFLWYAGAALTGLSFLTHGFTSAQPLDAITAFTVPNPNCTSQRRRFLQVWLPREVGHAVSLPVGHQRG
jgi:hypothetical protein